MASQGRRSGRGKLGCAAGRGKLGQDGSDSRRQAQLAPHPGSLLPRLPGLGRHVRRSCGFEADGLEKEVESKGRGEGVGCARRQGAGMRAACRLAAASRPGVGTPCSFASRGTSRRVRACRMSSSPNSSSSSAKKRYPFFPSCPGRSLTLLSWRCPVRGRTGFGEVWEGVGQVCVTRHAPCTSLIIPSVSRAPGSGGSTAPLMLQRTPTAAHAAHPVPTQTRRRRAHTPPAACTGFALSTFLPCNLLLCEVRPSDGDHEHPDLLPVHFLFIQGPQAFAGVDHGVRGPPPRLLIPAWRTECMATRRPHSDSGLQRLRALLIRP